MVIETKRMTNPHIHVVITRMDPEIITEAWEFVPRGGGGVSFKPLDRRGNHAKLAAYLVKESRSTMEKYREIGKRGKRYSKTQNMAKPVITYTTVAASSWRKEPKPSKAPCCTCSMTDPPRGAGGTKSAVTHTRNISRFSTNRRTP